MANKTTRQDTKLNERIAAIRENNARLENRHKEIEMDKRRAVETGSSILPSQIRITISRQDALAHRNGAHDGINYRGKQKQNYRYRGVGGGGTGIGYNLSKSLSRLHQDVNYNSQPQFSNNPSKGRGCCAKGNSINTFEYVRHVEIDRSGGRGKPQKYHQYQSNRTYYGPRNGPQQHYHHQQQQQQQQQTLTPAKSMPSLDPSNLRQSSRSFHHRGGGGAGSGFRPQQPPPPRFRHNSFRSSGGPVVSRQTPERSMVPPPPPPFPPPSPSKPTPAFWPPPPAPKGTDGQWIRGNVIRSKDNHIRRVAAIGTQSNGISKAHAASDSPFVNVEEDDEDDGYIDDNPLDDLDQFTLKIDMDGGFIVYDATICDPILSKPISSWIDDAASEANDSDAERRDGRQGSISSPPSQKATTSKTKTPAERAGKEVLDMESYIFSNSSLTTSGVSTLSSLDCRLVGEDVQVVSIQRSFSADNLDKFSKPHQHGDDQ